MKVDAPLYSFDAPEPEVRRLAPVDAHHLRPHVGQQHSRKRRRADARHLDDAVSGEGSHACLREHRGQTLRV